MTSAFRPVSTSWGPLGPGIKVWGQGGQNVCEHIRRAAAESETEDEEVKFSCGKGIRYMSDSDSECTEDETIEGAARFPKDIDRPRIIRFATQSFLHGRLIQIVKPQASLAKDGCFLHFSEDDDENSTSSDSSGEDEVEIKPLFSFRSIMQDSVESLTNDEEDSTADEEDETTEKESSEDEELSSTASEGETESLSRVVSVSTDLDASSVVRLLGGNKEEDEISAILGELEMNPNLSMTRVETPQGMIGVTSDRVDSLTVPSVKRVLSYKTLSQLSCDGEGDPSYKKRVKRSQTDSPEASPTTLFSALSLGLSPTDIDTGVVPSFVSPSWSRDVAEAHNMDGYFMGRHVDDNFVGKPPLVPQLTPHGSPLTIEEDENAGHLGEWSTAFESSRDENAWQPKMSPSFENVEQHEMLFIESC